MCGGDDLANMLRCDLAIVNSDGEALVLEPYAGNLGQDHI